MEGEHDGVTLPRPTPTQPMTEAGSTVPPSGLQSPYVMMGGAANGGVTQVSSQVQPQVVVRRPWGTGPAPAFRMGDMDKTAWNSVSKFTGEGKLEVFMRWIVEVECALRLCCLLVFMQTAQTPTDGGQDIECWQWYYDRAGFVFAKLIFCTDGLARKIVSQYQGDGVLALRALRAKFQLTHMASRLVKLRELLNLNMKDTEDPERLCIDAHRLVHEIVAMSSNLNEFADFLVVGTILSRLPRRYDNDVAALQTLLKLEYPELLRVMNVAFDREMARVRGGAGAGGASTGGTSTGGATTSAGGGVLAATSGPKPFKGVCWWCREEGHKETDDNGAVTCPKKAQGLPRVEQQQKQTDKKEKEKCGYCKNTGHDVPGCRTLQADIKSGKVRRGKPTSAAVDGQPGKDADLEGARVAQGGGFAACIEGVPSEEPAEAPAEAPAVCHVTTDAGATLVVRVDSACTWNHIVPDATWLDEVRVFNGTITVADGREQAATAIGTLRGRAANHLGELVHFSVRDVLVVPSIRHHLLSVEKLDEAGVEVWFGGGKCRLQQGNTVIVGAKSPTSRFYEIVLHREVSPRLRGAALTTASSGGGGGAPRPQPVLALPAPPLTQDEVWHRRVGHPHNKVLKQLGRMGVGVPANLELSAKCDTCEISKHTRTTFPKATRTRAERRLVRLHMDLMSMPEVSLGGHRHVLVIRDDATRLLITKLLRTQGEAPAAIKDALTRLPAMARGGSKVEVVEESEAIERVRSDNGKEFLAAKLDDFYTSMGIVRELTAPYSPAQNGVAERSIRTLSERARCGLRDAGLPACFWGYAVLWATYVINRTPTRSVGGGRTPHEAFYGVKADLSHFRAFGCKAFRHVEIRKKLDDKARVGIMVGYDATNRRTYLVYDFEHGKAYPTAHATFDEQSYPAPALLAQHGLAGSEEAEEEGPTERASGGGHLREPEEVRPPQARASVGAAPAEQVPAGAAPGSGQQPQLGQAKQQHQQKEQESSAGQQEQQEGGKGRGRPRRTPKPVDRLCLQTEAPPPEEPEERRDGHLCRDKECVAEHGQHHAHITFSQLTRIIPTVMALEGMGAGDSGGKVPTTVEEALRDPEFKVAHAKEVGALEEHNVFTPIDADELPDGVTVVKTKMLYTRKADDSAKAASSARGAVNGQASTTRR